MNNRQIQRNSLRFSQFDYLYVENLILYIWGSRALAYCAFSLSALFQKLVQVLLTPETQFIRHGGKGCCGHSKVNNIVLSKYIQ
jgi:hypothetical protein